MRLWWSIAAWWWRWKQRHRPAIVITFARRNEWREL
jgi:hypothetical protein